LKPIWSHPASLGPPFKPAPGDPVDSKHINKTFGILSTPVIDLDSEEIYALNWTLDSNSDRVLHLNAIRLKDGSQGAHKPPLAMSASFTNASGAVVKLNQVQKQRSALLLAPPHGSPGSTGHKMLYAGFTGSEEPPSNLDPTTVHHGWLLGFDV